MDKKILTILLLLVCLCSCQQEWLDEGQKQEVLLNDGFASLDGFQDYYWQTYNQSDLRSASVEGNRLHTDLVIEGASPVWDLAQKQIIGDSLRILSVPMEGARVLAPLSETLDSLSAVQHSERLFRLYLVNRSLKGAVGRGSSYYVYIKPSLKWLESGREYPVNFNAIPKGFDGEIELYSLNGELQQRLVCTEGKKATLYIARIEEKLRTLNMDDPTDKRCYTYFMSKIKYKYGGTAPMTEQERLELLAAFPGANVPDYMILAVPDVEITIRHLDCMDFNTQERIRTWLKQQTRSWEDERSLEELISMYLAPPGQYGSSSSGVGLSMKNLYLSTNVQDHISGQLQDFTMYSAKKLNTIFEEAMKDAPYRRMLEFMSGKGWKVSDIILHENRIGERASIDGERQLNIYGIDKFTSKSLKHELFHMYQKYIMQRDPNLVKKNIMGLKDDELKKVQEENYKVHLEIMKRQGFREFEVRLLENIFEFISFGGEEAEFNKRKDWVVQNKSYYQYLWDLTNKGTTYPSKIDTTGFYDWAWVFGQKSGYKEGDTIIPGKPYVFNYSRDIGYLPTAIEEFFSLFL